MYLYDFILTHNYNYYYKDKGEKGVKKAGNYNASKAKAWNYHQNINKT